MDDYVAYLKTLDFDVLSQIPSESVISKTSKSTLTLWHDQINGSWERFVVQEYTPKFFGMFGAMKAKGFVINEAGNLKELKDSDLYEFV